MIYTQDTEGVLVMVQARSKAVFLFTAYTYVRIILYYYTNLRLLVATRHLSLRHAGADISTGRSPNYYYISRARIVDEELVLLYGLHVGIITCEFTLLVLLRLRCQYGPGCQ